MCISSIGSKQQFKHSLCCYHDADDICKFYAIFMKMLIRACYEAFVIVEGDESDATATNLKMMPRQHIGSGSSWG